MATYFDTRTRHIAKGMVTPPWETLIMLESQTDDLRHQYNLKRKVTASYYQLDDYIENNSSPHVRSLISKVSLLLFYIKFSINFKLF